VTLGLPDRATGADEFLVHARWLSDFHRSRSRDVQTRAIARVCFTGVLTALLPNVVDALYHLPGDPSTVTRAALCSTAALLLATALCALQALRVRRPANPSHGGPRREEPDDREPTPSVRSAGQCGLAGQDRPPIATTRRAP